MPKLVFNPESEDARVVRFDADQLTVGSAIDNDVCIDDEGIAEYHARFERRGELVYVVNLADEIGTFVDGNPVQRFVLGHRAVVRLSNIDVLYLEEAPSTAIQLARPESAALEPVKPKNVHGLPACPNCDTVLQAGVNVCGKCGMIQPRSSGTPLAPADLFLRPEHSHHARGAGILPMLGFFFSLFGPLILGIGWLLGVIFGFISLSLIRQRGGFARDRRYAMWSIALGFLWLGAILGGTFWYFEHRHTRQQIARMEDVIKLNENDVAYLLREIAVVEKFIKSAQAVPLPDGGSAYATLKDLQTIPNPFLPEEHLLANIKGYLLTVKAQGADGFTVTAVPQQYGQTGRKTFSIDQTGVLVGGDIGGKQPWENRTVLPELDMGRSVYLEARERIARELLVEARRLAENQNFDRSQFVLRELQRDYVLTDTFKNFENVAKGVEQLVVNAKAQEATDKAMAALNDGKRAEALAAFKHIIATYPRAVNIEDVKAQAAAIEGQVAAERNQLAQTKWEEVLKLDKDGQLDQAMASYRALAAQFADTAVFKSNQAAIQSSLARLEETKASALFATLTGLNVSSNATQVLEVITTLQRDCPRAPTVTSNAAMLQTLQQQAQAQVDADEGVRLLGEQKYLEAAERFDKLLTSNPALVQQLTPQLEACYFQAGDLLFQSNKFAEASGAYEKFLQFTPNPEKLDQERLKQIYLSLGEINFFNKNYTNAVSYLRKGVKFFGDDPKYYRLYGQALLRQKKFNEALPAYQSLVNLSKSDSQARFERGLCLLGAARQAQTNLVVALTDAAASNMVIAVDVRPTSPVPFTLPTTIRDRKAKDTELEMIRDAQFEMRLADTTEKMKSYSAKTPEATIIREAIRLVNEIQTSASELTALSKDAISDVSQSKFNRARSQLLSVFTTQQDYFDKIIADKVAAKQALLTNLDVWKNMLTTATTDLSAAATLETYRALVLDMQKPLEQKVTLCNDACTQLKPVLENEIKYLEEARALIQLAVKQFKGWAIGWNLNDRIEKFFLINYTEISAKKADAEKKLQDAIAIDIPFEKNITL